MQSQSPNMDWDKVAPVDPNAPEGERGIRHAIIGGTTGYIIGHKSGHDVLGAAIGAVTGDFLSKERHDSNLAKTSPKRAMTNYAQTNECLEEVEPPV